MLALKESQLKTYYKPNSNLLHLFWSGVSRRVAVTMLWVFSPIYIYKLLTDADFSQQYALMFVSAWFLLIVVSKFIFMILAEDLSRKIGFKGTIRLSVVPFIFFIFALVFADRSIFVLLLSALFSGMHSGLFWWGYNGYFVKSANKNHFGESLGEVNILETVAAVATPLIGGMIIVAFSFNILFLMSILFMVMSSVLLGKDHDKRQEKDIKFSQVLHLMQKHSKSAVAYVGSSAEGTIAFVVWPIYLFLFFNGFIKIGFVVSISSFIAALFSLLIGKWADNRHGKQLVAFGAPIVTTSWIIRFLSRTPLFFVVADSIWQFGQRMVGLPLNALSYKKALGHEGSAAAILFREAALALGAIIALSMLCVLFYLGYDLKASFILAAIFSILPLLSVLRGSLND